MRKSLCREPTNENEQFKKKTWISNSYLISERFEGYRSKYDIAILRLMPLYITLTGPLVVFMDVKLSHPR